MKKTIVLVIGILMPLFIFSQIGFQEFYGRPNTDQFLSSIISLDDGNFLLGGTNGATIEQSNSYWIAHIDTLGSLNWEKTFSDSLSLRMWDLAKTKNNNIYLGGIQNNHKGYVIQLDSNFNHKWSRKIGNSTKDEHIYNIAPSLANGCLAILTSSYNNDKIYEINHAGDTSCVYTTNDDLTNISSTKDEIFISFKNNQSSYIKSLDFNGNSIWEKEILNNQNPNSKISDHQISLSRDSSNIFFTGKSESKFILTKLNLNGEIAWQKQDTISTGGFGRRLIEMPNGNLGLIKSGGYNIYKKTGELLKFENLYPFYHLIYDGAIIDSSQIITTGFHYNSGNGRDGKITLTNIDSQSKTHMTIGDSLPNGFENGYRFIKTFDNNFVLSGEKCFMGKKEDFHVIKVNQNGDVIWETNFGSEHSDYLYNIIQTKDSCFILSGNTGRIGNSKFLILKKINSNGELIWETEYDFDYEWDSWTPTVEMDDGSLIVGLSRFGFQVLVKFDKDGNYLWSDYVTNQTSIQDAIHTEQDNFLSVGYSSGYEGMIYKCDKQGNTIFSKHLNLSDVSNGGGLHSVIQLNDGGFLGTGRIFNDPEKTIYIIRFDNDGETIWENSLLML